MGDRPRTVTVIISTFNEMGLGFLKCSLENLSKLKNINILCVDGGSSDGTIELIKSYKVELHSLINSSRAQRLNLGITKASSQMIFLHHPRSIIDPASLSYIVKNLDQLEWGALTHQFDVDSLLLRFTSWYSNNVRGRVREIFYLDHCIFFRKSFAENDDHFVKEVDIFEDTELSLMLKSYCVPLRLEGTSLTSATRFSTNGIWKQALLNQVLKWKYYFKFNHKEMNKSYEKNTKLNSDYTTKD